MCNIQCSVYLTKTWPTYPIAIEANIRVKHSDHSVGVLLSDKGLLKRTPGLVLRSQIDS